MGKVNKLLLGGISIRYDNIGDIRPLLNSSMFYNPSGPMLAGKSTPYIPNNVLKIEEKNTSLYYTDHPNYKTSKLGGVASNGIKALSSQLFDLLSGVFGDSEWGRNLGTIFSRGASSATNTLTDNLVKGVSLTEGLGENMASSIGGTLAGMTGNLIGQGINSLGGDTRLSRGIGQGIATGIGTLGGDYLTKGETFNSVKNLVSIPKRMKEAKAALSAAKTSTEISKAKDKVNSLKGLKALSTADKWNLTGLAGSVIGSGLEAATGPSKEYGGKYGNITQGMDTAYGLAQTAVGLIPGVGTGISGLMALNKGLSNIFGSTDGMTVQDAVLGSAFMLAPVKWLNMAGASTTGTFNNLSWLNTEKTNSFMGNAFGNLHDKFDHAKEVAGKTYGTFSLGAYKNAEKDLTEANLAWSQIMNMADLNELQNIRSLYMTSINNLRYAQNILGGFSPIFRGKQGMKIFNNATNHNMAMRLLSGAALIDNKQMILCNVPD